MFHVILLNNFNDESSIYFLISCLVLKNLNKTNYAASSEKLFSA